jgi:cell shape-determining protein MreC
MLAGLTPKRRGRRPQESPLEKECHQLRRENERLRAKLRQAEIVIDVQKKVSEILGFPLATPDSTDET